MYLEKLRSIGKSSLTRKTIIFMLTFAFIYFIMITSLVTKQYNLAVGDIAKSDIKATRETTDEIATEKRKAQMLLKIHGKMSLIEVCI